MGINRSSMYAAFGDKDALFHRALGRCREAPMTYIRQALAQRLLRDAIAGLINGAVEFLSTPDNPRGCLQVQGALACGTDAQPVKQTMIAWRRVGRPPSESVCSRRNPKELPVEFQPGACALSLLGNGGARDSSCLRCNQIEVAARWRNRLALPRSRASLFAPTGKSAGR